MYIKKCIKQQLLSANAIKARKQQFPSAAGDINGNGACDQLTKPVDTYVCIYGMYVCMHICVYVYRLLLVPLK